MALSHGFREVIMERARRDEAFRDALIDEALQLAIEGNLETAKTLLRDCIDAVAAEKDRETQ